MFSGLPGGKPLFSLPSIRQKVWWTFLVILYTKGADSDSFCEGMVCKGDFVARMIM